MSIAFGYAGESYVDFGPPWMFLPVFGYGFLMGLAYLWFLRTVRHQELAKALVSVVFWLSLYLFERSWSRTLGQAGTLMIYLGGAAILIDRVLLSRFAKRRASRVIGSPVGRNQAPRRIAGQVRQVRSPDSP